MPLGIHLLMMTLRGLIALMLASSCTPVVVGVTNVICLSFCVDTLRRLLTMTIEEAIKNKQACIDVYESLGGWKARLLTPDPDCGGWLTPEATGIGYETKAEAIFAAKHWSIMEDIPYVGDNV
jgi:hypothetical protein